MKFNSFLYPQLLVGLLFSSFCASVSAAGVTELLHCQPPGSAPTGEEAVVRQAAEAAGLDGREVLARLVFAEALSTGYWSGRCQAAAGGESLFEGVAWGVARRIVERVGRGKVGAVPDKAVFDVVFGRNQFRTSFSGRGKPNPFAQALLCPLSAQAYLKQAGDAQTLFAQARQTADRVLAALDDHYRQGTALSHPAFRASNFFYPHSERFGELRPAWAANPDAKLNRGYLALSRDERPCIEYYDLR